MGNGYWVNELLRLIFGALNVGWHPLPDYGSD